MSKGRRWFNNLGLVVLLIFIQSMGAAHIAAAAVFETTQVTDNGYNDYYPQVDGDYVVWHGSADADQEIFLHTISSGVTTQITGNNYNDLLPQVARKQVVWHGYDGSDYEIFAYDISSGDTTQLTDNSYDDIYPQVDGDNVAWQGWDGSDDEIFLYNLYTGSATQLTDNTKNDRRPQVSGDKVVWRAEGGSGYEISLYDISSTVSTSLDGGAMHWSFPQIGGDYIVWESRIGDYIEISSYNILTETTTQVTYNSYSYFPQVSDGNLVWEGVVQTGLEIFLYNIADSTTTQVTEDSYQDWYPQISGDNVVWLQYGSAVRDVMLYQIASGETTALTSGSFCYGPQVDAGRVVWLAKGGADWEIYMATVNNTLAGAGVAPVSVDIEGNVNVVFSDVTSDGYTFVTESSTASPPPGGFAVLGNQFDITTTAGFTAPVTVTLPYDENDVPGNESDLKMYHWDGSSWEDATVSVDTTNNTITGQSNSLSPFLFGNPLAIPAALDFDPDTLNLKSQGDVVTAYLEMPAEYDLSNVDISTLLLNGAISAESAPTDLGDHNGNAIADLMIKFDRTLLQETVSPGEAVELKITGSLNDGTAFTGSNTIRVIDKGKDHIDESNASSVVY